VVPLRYVHFPLLTLESIQNLSPGLYAVHQKETYTNFRQRPLSDIVQQYAAVLVRPRAIDIAMVQPSERYIKKAQ